MTPGNIIGPWFCGTLNYTARVEHGTTAVSVTPRASDANAAITVNGVAVASGTASPAIALTPADMTLTIRVTAQNGANATTYVVTLQEITTYQDWRRVPARSIPRSRPIPWNI